MPFTDREPLLTVPAVVFPERSIGHAEAVRVAGDQYAHLCAKNRDPGYQKDFAREVERGLMMAARLSIDDHPVHLPAEEMTRPRGFAERNEQALAAFRQYVPAAAVTALAAAGLTAADVDAVLVETSTVTAMPSLAYQLIDMIGLRPSAEVLPYASLGCNGGAHAVARGRDYLLAHPGRVLLVIAADYASPWFFTEPSLRGSDLHGSVISSALFSDAAAAAVMTGGGRGVPGFRIGETASFCVPGTQDALRWSVEDDGLHFRLTDQATKLVPDIAKEIAALLAAQGLDAADLAVCSLHSGGDAIIRSVRDTLGLTDRQVEPARRSLRRGNTMSVAVFDALRLIAGTPGLLPEHGAHGLGAGFGPGFASQFFLWRYDCGDPARP